MYKKSSERVDISILATLVITDWSLEMWLLMLSTGRVLPIFSDLHLLDHESRVRMDVFVDMVCCRQ